MARPKTTGDPITFRLPLHLQVVAETLAGRMNTNVSDYVRGRIVAGLEREAVRLEAERADPGTACGHGGYHTVPSTGTRVCDTCGMISNDRGATWGRA